MQDIKGGILDPILQGNGVLYSYSSQINKTFDACTSEVTLSIYEIDLFIDQVKKFGWSAYSNEPNLWAYAEGDSAWGIELVVVATDYTPTLEFNGRKVTLSIDPGPGYNKGRMTYYLNEGWGVFNANIRLTTEIMRDLIAVMMYCLEHEDEIRT